MNQYQKEASENLIDNRKGKNQSTILKKSQANVAPLFWYPLTTGHNKEGEKHGRIPQTDQREGLFLPHGAAMKQSRLVGEDCDGRGKRHTKGQPRASRHITYHIFVCNFEMKNRKWKITCELVPMIFSWNDELDMFSGRKYSELRF